MSENDIVAGTKARFDRFNVDLDTGKLQRSGLNVPIQAQPFQVLRSSDCRCKVVNRDQLRAALWPEDTFVDFEHGLNTAVRKLRQALEDSADNSKVYRNDSEARLSVDGFGGVGSGRVGSEGKRLARCREPRGAHVPDNAETSSASNSKHSGREFLSGHGRSLVHPSESLWLASLLEENSAPGRNSRSAASFSGREGAATDRQPGRTRP